MYAYGWHRWKYLGFLLRSQVSLKKKSGGVRSADLLGIKYSPPGNCPQGITSQEQHNE